MNELKLDDHVQLYGYGLIGTVIQFLDFHQENVIVQWDNGGTELLPAADLHRVDQLIRNYFMEDGWIIQ